MISKSSKRTPCMCPRTPPRVRTCVRTSVRVCVYGFAHGSEALRARQPWKLRTRGRARELAAAEYDPASSSSHPGPLPRPHGRTRTLWDGGYVLNRYLVECAVPGLGLDQTRNVRRMDEWTGAGNGSGWWWGGGRLGSSCV